jgi:aminoglycoside phosphotransferase (APT) family kinase protein
MVSRTKYEIGSQAIGALFRAAGLGEATRVAPLGAGEYNAVFSVTAGGKEYVIKIAPADDNAAVMTCEKGMMAAEVFWYQMIRERTSIAVPEIYAVDLERRRIPTDYFIMEKLPGLTLDKIRLSKTEKKDTAAQMARMAAQIHGVKNSRFGSVQGELYGDWHQAVRAMVETMLADCARKGRQSKRGERLLAYIDQYKGVLQKAECCMVNSDLWPPNIICKRENGAIHCAWIDVERSYWGDRVVDFVSLEMTKPLPGKKATLAAYNAAADQPVLATEEETIRYAVAQAYLGLVMETEKYFRYTPRHFGWWRNVFASKWLFARAFGALGPH